MLHVSSMQLAARHSRTHILKGIYFYFKSFVFQNSHADSNHHHFSRPLKEHRHGPGARLEEKKEDSQVSQRTTAGSSSDMARDLSLFKTSERGLLLNSFHPKFLFKRGFERWLLKNVYYFYREVSSVCHPCWVDHKSCNSSSR